MITIECIELLSLNHEIQYLGDTFAYRAIQNVTLKGRITSVPGSEVDSIWTQSNSLISSLQDWDDFQINGQNIGNGRIVGVDFEVGVDVQSKPYIITLEILKPGNLFNMAGGEYSNLSFNLEHLKFVNNLSESFEFDSNGFVNNTSTKESYTYKRSVQIDIEENTTVNAVTLAKTLFSELILTDNPSMDIVQAAYPNFYSTALKRYNEEYDLRNNSFSFSEEISFAGSGATAESFLHNFTQSASINESGVTVRRNGDITKVNTASITTIEAYYESQKTAIKTELDAFYAAVATKYGFSAASCPLHDNPTEENVGVRPSENFLDYSLSYTNSSSEYSGYRWVYSLDISESESIYNISESGSLAAYGYEGDSAARFTFIKGVFDNTIKPGVEGRIQAAYLEYTPKTNTSLLKIISEEVSLSEFSAEMDYSYEYSDDPALSQSTNENIKRVVTTVTDNSPTPVSSFFHVIGDTEQVYGGAETTLGSFEINIEMSGSEGLSFQEYLEEAWIQSLIPDLTNSTYFLSDCNYTFNPIENTFNMSITYAYDNGSFNNLFHNNNNPSTIL